jgi:hypothetical protein
MSNEDREAKGALWLRRLQEAAALKESLVDYCRRRGLKPGEAYQWKRNLRSAGRWPELPAEAANTSRSTVVAAAARVCAWCRRIERCRHLCICNCIWRTAVEPNFC